LKNKKQQQSNGRRARTLAKERHTKNHQPLTVDTFVLEVVFDKKRLRKHKTTTKPSTINLEKQKTTLIKRSTTLKDAGKGKT